MQPHAVFSNIGSVPVYVQGYAPATQAFAAPRYAGLDYLENPVDEARLLRAVAEGTRWSIA